LDQPAGNQKGDVREINFSSRLVLCVGRWKAKNAGGLTKKGSPGQKTLRRSRVRGLFV